MGDTQNSNKTIAKNTFFLYIRMFFAMIVSLYTSRIILRELGIIDFGINNVVGSVLALFTFIQGSLSSASSRFLAFEIGKENGNINKVFCLTLNIHLIFAVLILLLCETVGLWYFYNKLVLPVDRFNAALVVYHMSVIGSVLTLLVIPYNAMIIAQEHMKAFAFLGIINVLFKLLVAYVLCVTPFDKLITNSVLITGFGLLINVMYYCYCKKKFIECNYQKCWDSKLFREILVYSGWSIASYSSVVVSQLSNLLINAFFGPVVNAARAITNTVQQNISSFVLNFQIAVNPQIIKNYASNNFERVFSLTIISQKISFALLYILFLPLLTNIDYILSIWLVEVPAYSNSLVIIISISCVFLTIVNPLSVIAEAANKLKIYNLVSIPYYFISIIVVYVALLSGCDVNVMFLIYAIFDVCYFLVIMRVTHTFISISYRQQLNTFARVFIAVIIGVIYGSLCDYFELPNALIEFFIKAAVSFGFALAVLTSVVLTKNERILVLNVIKSKVFHNQHIENISI